MRNIFERRIEFKPYEYPELLEFKDAIHHSFWLHTEFNLTSDIQEYLTQISPQEKEVLTRAMLAISQVEVSVKRFWADLYHYFPKPEIDSVGLTFADSEVRHADAYAFLLEKLGMNDLFKNIKSIPCLMKRVEHMTKFTKDKGLGERHFIASLILFSLFVEHISLFGQFFIIMSFNKHKNLFKGISNVVEATSKEEEIHAQFGFTLVKILQQEHPDLFDQTFYSMLNQTITEAIETEEEIIDWIFERGDLTFINQNVVKAYIKNRLNNACDIIGVNREPFPTAHKLLEETKWFDIEVLSSKETDFFYKRSIDYTKKAKEITADDLF